MGFSFEYLINIEDPLTYDSSNRTIIDTDNLIDGSDAFIIGSKFKDQFSEHVDEQVQKIKTDTRIRKLKIHRVEVLKIKSQY